ncbi:MAG: sodium/proline symporter [Myxococcales bacterium]|nr:sodium/proline symporter [Myxococcales bacterium]
MTPVIISFLFFLALFVVIGVLSARRAKATADDYLIASRDVHPWLAALSAVSTNNSGFMFVGLIGETYKTGVSAAWIMIGWVLGDWATWLFIHRHVRERSEKLEVATIPGYLGGRTRGERIVIALAAVITLAFLGTYAAAQLKAGSKALHVLFGWSKAAGAIIGAVIVVAYCIAGGIRASIWTDTAQSAVMIVSMLLLVVVGVNASGGFSGLASKLDALDPQLLSWAPKAAALGSVPWVIGWFAAGAGAVGQPHIMIRLMAIRSSEQVKTARRVYLVWNGVFAAAAIIAGLVSRVLLDTSQTFDAELALPRLAQQLLPAVMIGLVLAGLFAATMSTADSQVLSCSAALTQDLIPRWGESYWRIKLGTALVTGAALLVALAGSENVFTLVVMSWSGLACGLGPLLVVRSLERDRASARVGVAMMVCGFATSVLWRYVFGLSGAVYEVLPGMVAGFAVYGIARAMRR